MATQIVPVEISAGFYWKKHIYFSRMIDGPSKAIDCMNECLNVHTTCQFFVFENGVCHLGKLSIANGIVDEDVDDVTIYAAIGKLTYDCNCN